MIKQQVQEALSKALGAKEITLLTPKDTSFGDYAVNVHQLVGEDKKADGAFLVKKLQENELFEKVELKGSFINLFVSQKILLDKLGYLLKNPDSYGATHLLTDQKIMVEFAHPNTHKIFHIGHLRNISIGESLSRILTKNGAQVIRANYQGDVGLHIAKSLYGIMQTPGGIETVKEAPLDEKVAFLGKTYAEGNKAYEEDSVAKEKVHKINEQIYARDPEIQSLLETTRQWSLDYFDEIYKRVGTKFDRLYFESEVSEQGLEIAKKALESGILTTNDGAVILDGEKHGVDTRVFINSLGLPTYEAKELGLAELEFSEHGSLDRNIHVVGPEQKSFFKTTFKTQELLDPKKYQGKQFHYAYGFVDLKDGKMSSRQGNVLSGAWLLNEARKRVVDAFSVDKNTAEVITIGAVKYGFLKVDAVKNISFDIKESISIKGNSGPYLQYAYARTQSLLQNGNWTTASAKFTSDINAEELALLRAFPRFAETVEEAGKSYSPHVIATYLYDLAQKFSAFYEKQQILQAEAKSRDFRLALSAATGQIIKNGLYLLGVEVLEKI